MKINWYGVLSVCALGPLVLAIAGLWLSLPFIVYKEEGWGGVACLVYAHIAVAWVLVSMCRRDGIEDYF